MRMSCLVWPAIAAVIAGAPAVASADARFLEPYGELFQARTFLASPQDDRPKDALQSQPSGADAPRSRFLVTPFVRDSDREFKPGIGFGYASNGFPRHPWEVGFTYFSWQVPGRRGSFDTLEAGGKIVLSQPKRADLPVLSLAGWYTDPEELGYRVNVAVAADQKISREIYATANLGWAHQTGLGSDFVSGFGATYHPSRLPRLSLSADYVPRNNVAAEDLWSVSALWSFDRTSAVRLGGGKHGAVFANYYARFDGK